MSVKKHHVCKKDDIFYPAKYCCKNGKHLASIFDDLVITCDKLKEMAKTDPAESVLTKSTSAKFLYFTNLFIYYHSIIDSR